jgi:galactokinase
VNAELSRELADFARRARSASSDGGALPGFFNAGHDMMLARAPGRLDVMGGIADYSGSLVLELPIREGAFAAAQRSDDGLLRVASVSPDGSAKTRELTVRASELAGGYGAARAVFSSTPDAGWGAYVAGVLAALIERGAGLRGARLLVSSAVPEGKGVASSAAVSVASLAAASAAFGVTLGPVELALACQKVENLVAGAPSGVMDQMTTALGREGKLLELLCQPALVRGHVDVPAGVRFFGIDSGLRHAVSGADYGVVRVAAFMGYRILAEREGFSCERAGERVAIDDPRFGGYLANVPRELALRHRDALPERVRGAEFLARYGGTTDPVTTVDPGTTYPVRAATFHPVLEHERVQAFAAALPHASDDATLALLGELMSGSHASYSACGLGSDGTDLLVELVRNTPPGEGLYGAKITGGGSGGTVAVLAATGAEPAVRRVAAEYAGRTGRAPHVFSGSSPGATEFGVHRLRSDGSITNEGALGGG